MRGGHPRVSDQSFHDVYVFPSSCKSRGGQEVSVLGLLYSVSDGFLVVLGLLM